MKSCKNCYWKYKETELAEIGNIWCACEKSKPENEICKEHNYTCENCGSTFAIFKNGDKKLCIKCMIEALGIEKKVTTSYYLDNKYIGDSRDLGQVIEVAASNLDLDIDALFIEEVRE